MIYQKGICAVTGKWVILGAEYSIINKLDKMTNQQYKVFAFNKVISFPCEIECGSLTNDCPVYKKFVKEIPYSG